MNEEQKDIQARPIDTPLMVVNSSQILAIGYDQNTSTLRVIFSPKKDGAASRYDYDNVPAQVFADMKTAESVGKFFGTNVKHAFEFAKQPDVLPAEVETLLKLRAQLSAQAEVANG